MDERYWLFWDGECGFCRRAVAWVKRHDTRDLLHAVPYQEAPRPPMTEALAARCAHAVHVITPEGRVLAAGRASLLVLETIGFRRLAALFSRRPLIWLVEIVYWIVARHRPFFGRFLFRRHLQG